MLNMGGVYPHAGPSPKRQQAWPVEHQVGAGSGMGLGNGYGFPSFGFGVGAANPNGPPQGQSLVGGELQSSAAVYGRGIVV